MPAKHTVLKRNLTDEDVKRLADGYDKSEADAAEQAATDKAAAAAKPGKSKDSSGDSR